MALLLPLISIINPLICERVTRLLDEIPSLEKFDFIKAIAHPLPLIVITEMLGIPACDLYWRLSLNCANFRTKRTIFSPLHFFEKNLLNSF